MLKYANFDIVFQEVPDEVTLAINISNCPRIAVLSELPNIYRAIVLGGHICHILYLRLGVVDTIAVELQDHLAVHLR